MDAQGKENTDRNKISVLTVLWGKKEHDPSSLHTTNTAH